MIRKNQVTISTLKTQQKITCDETFTFWKEEHVWLVDIVDEAFNVTCQGAKSEEGYRNREDVKAAWKEDAKMFATIGGKIAKTLNGSDNSTQQWNLQLFLMEDEHCTSRPQMRVCSVKLISDHSLAAAGY